MTAKECLQKTENFVRRAVYSDVYFACICVVAFLCWCLNWSAVGLILLVAATCVTLLFGNDASSTFLPVMVCLTAIRNPAEITPVVLAVTIAPLTVCIVLFVCRNLPKTVVLGRMFVPQAAVSLALLVGGLGVVSASNYLAELPLVLALGVGMLLTYFVFVNSTGRNSVDVPLCFAKACVYVGLVVCAELAVLIAQSTLEPSQWSQSYWDFGWGNRGMAATFIPFAMVMSLYLSVRTKKHAFAYVLISFVMLLCLALTLSRAATLFGAVAFVCALVAAIVLGNKKQTLVCVAGAVAVGILACAIFWQQVSQLVEGLLSRFSQIKIYFAEGKLVIEGTSGRFGEDGLYGKAWQFFKQSPLFGIGMGGHPNVAINDSPDACARFHSTVFEVIASMGIVGIVCYVFYYVMRFREVLAKPRRKNPFALFTLFAWIAFEGQGLVDMNTFEPVFSFFVVFQLVVLQKLDGSCEKTEILQLLPPAEMVATKSICHSPEVVEAKSVQ